MRKFFRSFEGGEGLFEVKTKKNQPWWKQTYKKYSEIQLQMVNYLRCTLHKMTDKKL